VAQNRPPNRGRPKQCCSVAACESADVRDPFLSLRLDCGSGLCRKLEHCCLLTFEHVSEEHHLPVWKFQRIMVCPRVVLVDLPEDGSHVIDCNRFPDKQPALPTPHLLGKGELRSRKNTNCCPDVFRRSKPSMRLHGSAIRPWPSGKIMAATPRTLEAAHTPSKHAYSTSGRCCSGHVEWPNSIRTEIEPCPRSALNLSQGMP
jgi:hypothetical protein